MRLRGMRWPVAFLAILFVTVTWPAAQEQTQPAEESGLTVTLAAIARSVENREPVGADIEFPPDVGQLACFTKVEGASDETVIYHTWRHGEEVKARVELDVRSSSWRTWSTKQILPHWTGVWTVDVEDAEGNVLKSLSFTITGM